MADITLSITIPDNKVSRVQAAFTPVFGETPTRALIEAWLRKRIVGVVRKHEYNLATDDIMAGIEDVI